MLFFTGSQSAWDDPFESAEARVSYFFSFCERHKRLLNALCRKNVSLLKASTGAFRAALWHPNRILDFDIRRNYFQMQNRKRRRQGGVFPRPLKLHVRREFLFEDSFHQLKKFKGNDLMGKLSIKFFAEEGVDAGGLTKEWFLALSRAIFNPDYALFVAAANNSNVFQPNKLRSGRCAPTQTHIHIHTHIHALST